jgi:hypothetical protein
VLAQPRTSIAIDDARIELVKGRWGREHGLILGEKGKPGAGGALGRKTDICV